ncbi:molybdopterin molybdenumtransferase MoeA [Sporolactobacillus sp. THM7-7]|nr:molybdopterin molybdenumtransferase MoeA [Sporolactobacillus sp. THM7-7]
MILLRKPIPVQEAVQKVMSVSHVLPSENISLEHGYGRVLADDVYAPHPVPWFIRSPYDGYAFAAHATIKAGAGHSVLLEVVGAIGRGDDWEGTLQDGQAVKVMTGSALPDGADAVMMDELVRVKTDPEGKTFIEIRRHVSQGENVCQIGEDIREGQLLVRKGTVINPGVMAILATFGYSTISVVRKPKVGLIVSGTDLLSLEEPLQIGKVRNSNAYMLYAQCQRARSEIKKYGQIGDTIEDSVKKIKHALKESDLVVTTGGVSVGDTDIMPKVYKEIGALLLFNKVTMRPGSVTSAAQIDNKLLIGLSGNPSACYVGFELFARPALQKLQGISHPYLRKTQAVLKTDFPKANPVTRFVRGCTSLYEGKVYVEPTGSKDKSNIVSSLSGANSFIVLPAGSKGWKAGSTVDVLLLEKDDRDKAGS